MLRMQKIFLIGLALTGMASDAHANCVCRCVNGEMQAICQSSIDLPPICPPTICPTTPPAIEPLPSLRIPPIGTSQCRNVQVLNPRTNRYEWREVCH